MTNTVKVAQLPGKVQEIVAESTTSFREAIELAGLDASGFEVKADGTTVSNLDAQIGEVSMILLAKLVKGNSGLVKVAQLPGKVQEIATDASTTFRQAIELAGLDATGFEVKADGSTVSNLDAEIGSTSMILLAKLVKGNSGLVKVAQLPGKVQEIAADSSTTFRQAIELAGLDASGFEVKADGSTVSNLDAEIGSTSMILLAKQVKGNVKG